MSGSGAADIEHEEERPNSQASAPLTGAEATATRQPKRGLLPARRRTLRRQLGELQAEVVYYERQVERAQADLQDVRGQLLEHKRKLEQTEQALQRQAALLAAAEASLQAREEALTAARDDLAQLQAELEASKRQRLELEATLGAARERISQLERARPRRQDALLEAAAGGERNGSSEQALRERARDAPPKPNHEQRQAERRPQARTSSRRPIVLQASHG